MFIDSVATYASRTPEALACIDLETQQRWNYHQFDGVINQVAHWLISELGPSSRKRVVTIAKNSASLLILNLACVRAGAIYVPINWRLLAKEVMGIISDAEPDLIIYEKPFKPDYFSIKKIQLNSLLPNAAGFSKSVAQGARLDNQETSLLLYTSGTSGQPKGVEISEINAYWGQVAFNSGSQVVDGRVFLCDMPLFHTAGLLLSARGPLQMGGAVLISRGFDPRTTLDRLTDPELAITHYFSVPQMASRIWDLPEFDPAKLERLLVWSTGGAPISKSLVERFIRAGIPLSHGFGMTETGSVSGNSVINRDVLLAKLGSSGALFSGVEAQIVDNSGAPMPTNEVGELWLRGPGVTRGYWRKPQTTARAFSAGWFKSGDMAYFDEDGYLFVVDRKKDMYISGGENVYCTEVESVIAEIKDIVDVAVVGIPDSEWGEVGVAFVVAKSIAINDITILQHCRNRLAHFKTPKFIHFVDRLPCTTTGKVKKHLLVDRLVGC